MPTDQLSANQSLQPGQYIVSQNGLYQMVFQSDGNLVVYKIRPGAPSRALWASGTNGRSTAKCVMQADGNLVIYDSNTHAVWASNTGHAGSRIVMQDDGNLVIYQPNNAAVWATNTVQPSLPSGPVAQGSTMKPGDVLRIDQPLKSANGRYSLVFQADGNLVLYGRYSGSALWSSQTNGKTADVCIMQTDGNLVIYGPDCQALWSSNSYGHPGSRLDLQDDGNVVIYQPNNTALWATHTMQAARDHLSANESLQPGQFLVSQNRLYEMAFQSDGNLVVYKIRPGALSRALWGSGTNGRSTATCVMQSDGNLVIYDSSTRAVWASNTPGHAGSRILMQDDGNLVIYQPNNAAVWATNTVQPSLPSGPIAQGSTMKPGDVLRIDQPLKSANGRYSLVFQADGNLVLYRSPTTALWSSQTNGKTADVCIMQTDGNLVIYGPDCQALWSSNSSGHPGSRLDVQDDGNVVIYQPNNATLWATGTAQAALEQGPSYDPAILLGAAGPWLDPSRLADDAMVDELARWGLGIAMQGLGRALRYVERPDREVLPADLGSAERQLVALLQRRPDLRPELVARLDASDAVVRAALAPASELVLARPTLSVLPQPLAVGPVAPTTVGQVRSALTTRDRVVATVRRIECVRETPGSGADELVVALILKGPGDAVVAAQPLWVGDFDTGTDHPYSGDPLDIDWPTAKVELTLPAIKIGDEFRVAAILAEDDSYSSFWTAMAQMVHQMGLVALYVYVAYQTGGDLASAAAWTELADKAGQRIAGFLQQFAAADQIGMGATAWRYTGSPEESPPPIDVYPKRVPTAPPDPNKSYYRLHFKIATTVVPKPFDGTPNESLTNPTFTIQPVEFVQLYDAVFRAIAVGWDAERGQPVLWGIAADGRVKYRVGVRDTNDAGWILLPPTPMHALAPGWTLDAAGMLHRASDSGFERDGWTFQDVSIGRDGPVWGVQEDGSLWRRVSSGPLVSNRWQRVPGTVRRVAAASHGEVWALNSQGRPMRWDGTAAFMPADAGAGALHVLGLAPGMVLAADGGGQLWNWDETSRTWRVWPAMTRLRDGRRVPLVVRQVCPVVDFGGKRAIVALDPQGRVHLHYTDVN